MLKINSNSVPKLSDNKITGKSIGRFALFCLYLTFFYFCLQSPSFAVSLEYSLKVGSTYTFEVSTSIDSGIETFGFKKSEPKETKSTVSAEVIMFRSGVWILDVRDGKRRFRRYLRPDGSLPLSPEEDPTLTPFFLSFPTGDLKPGKVHEIKSSIQAGNKTVPANWAMKVIEPPPGSRKIPLTLSADISLPSTRLIHRSLAVHGTFVMDTEAGCPSEGDWSVQYSLQYANKELAIIRPMWTYRQNRKISFRLKEVK